MCTHAGQVEHQRCSRNGRVQKIKKILRKNTIFNEHPVCARELNGKKENSNFEILQKRNQVLGIINFRHNIDIVIDTPRKFFLIYFKIEIAKMAPKF